MTIDRGFLEKIRTRGEEVLTQVSAELMSNPRFVKAVESAMRGREKLEQAAASTLKEMNVPTRSDIKRANSRIEALEREVAELRSRVRGRAAPRRPAGKSATRAQTARSTASRATGARKAAPRRGRGKTSPTTG
jgi:Poly(R)-hydroxyalkanoic acid synthase subunit (PHA_synth_III_E)